MSAPRQTEEDFLQLVKDLAKLLGWLTYHTLNSKGSDAGFPDLVLTRGKRLILAELKIPPNKPTPSQNEWLTALARTPAEVYVWEPHHFPQIQEVLT